MFRMHRSFRVADGMGGEVRSYLSQIAAYVLDHYDVAVQVFVEVFGPTTAAAHLMMDFDDLSTFETFWAQLGGDEAFGRLLEIEASIRIEGSVQQALLHSHR